jgi:hypothetical protein
MHQSTQVINLEQLGQKEIHYDLKLSCKNYNVSYHN